MEEIKQIVKDEHQRGYQEGYDDGVLDCRRERAKYTAEKLYDALRLICDSPNDDGMPYDDVISVFGTLGVSAILYEFSAKEIIDKVEAYKEKKEQEEEEIRVGDALKSIAEIDEDDALEYVVTYIDVDHKHYDCICLDGSVYQDVDIQAMAKTGKRYEIHLKEGKNVAVSD
jgi:hypothetical protein